MPTVFRSGTHRSCRLPGVSRAGPRIRQTTRRNWRTCDRSLSRPGPRPQRRPNPLTGLAEALRALVRFHEAHADWLQPDPVEYSVPRLDPEWEAAIKRAYAAAKQSGLGDASPVGSSG
jgi:hypothetical protein